LIDFVKASLFAGDGEGAVLVSAVSETPPP
jgi:hypothetical protein